MPCASSSGSGSCAFPADAPLSNFVAARGNPVVGSKLRGGGRIFERRKGRMAAVVGASGAALVLVATTASALPRRAAALHTVPAPSFVTNGSVAAIVPTPGAVYIAGDFSLVAPRTGPGVGI